MHERQTMRYAILIVDDVSRNIQILGNILRPQGYSISYATSGREALDLIVSEHFDLILLDIMMPDMDGYEVCRRLQEGGYIKDVPVIFLTARTEKEDIIEGFRLGAVDYITKPFHSEELLARVKNHVLLKASRQEIERKNSEMTDKNEELKRLNRNLKEAFQEIKTLRGLLPMCSYCKKIRTEGAPAEKMESWISLERYIRDHTEAEVTHGMCPDCARKHFPDIFLEKR
ncbi:MAG: response regulator [Deltaproteobacteria bacterium]|nr:response regulator [Deltaproteobacteria bacterium]